MTLPLVIALGNEHRGDDAAGLRLAERLRERVGTAARFHACRGDLTALLDLWRDVELVYVLDALCGVRPGTVRRFESAEVEANAAAGGVSSHGLGIADALRLGRAVGRLPRRLIVVTVEGADFAVGKTALTAAVAAAVESTAAALAVELGAGGARA